MITLEKYDYQKLENGIYLVRLRPSSDNHVAIVYHKNGKFWLLKGKENYATLDWEPILDCLIAWYGKLPENIEQYAEDESRRYPYTP